MALKTELNKGGLNAGLLQGQAATSSAPPVTQAEGAKPIEEPALLGVEAQRALQKTVTVQGAQAATTQKAYDYVFIGAGATGGTAAADLTALLSQAEELRKQGFSVLVLEGGVDKNVRASQIPAEHGVASEHPDLLADPNRTGTGSGYRVRHFADDAQAKKDPKADENGEIWKPRGEGFGGSTRMNANIFVRVDDVDWNKIAVATGDPAFRAENMKPLFQELQKAEYRPLLKLLHNIGTRTGIGALQNRGGLGFEGRLEVTRGDPKLLLEDKQLAQIATKTLWYSMTRLGSMGDKMKRVLAAFDPNDDRTQGTEGPVVVPTTITSEGKRNGARDILLDAAKKYPEQLELRDGARVRNIVLDDNNKVTGAVYFDKDGNEHTVTIRREAIVAAGAMESAALLMRSGIGPKEELEKLKAHGIEPRITLPGVGQKQSDRYEVGVVFRMKEPFSTLQKLNLPAADDDPAYQRWAAGQGGVLASNGAVIAFQMKSKPELEDPDLFVFAVPGRFEGYKPGYSAEAGADPHMLTFLVLDENKGEGKGTVRLDPDNPFGAPIINHHFHAERQEGDSDALIAGVEKVRDLVKTQFANLIDSEVWPGPGADTQQALKEAVESASWGHHPRGGAQMGHPNNPDTVVDGDFKVLGTTGLRVIDASMLPDNIGSFIASGLYQIGKLAAKKIARDADEGPRPAAAFNALSIRNAPKPESLKEAQKVTKSSADAAQAAGLISEKQHRELTDGTVSKLDMDVAWAAIERALDGPSGAGLGSDRHTLAHNLLLAVGQQLEKQGGFQTRKETFLNQLDALMPGG